MTTKKYKKITIFLLLILFIQLTSTIYSNDKPAKKNIKLHIQYQNDNSYTHFEKFGLKYDKSNNILYYKNRKVRYFVDQNKAGINTSYLSSDKKGTVDIYAEYRNDNGKNKLSGIKKFSKLEYKLRSAKLEAEQKMDPDFSKDTFRFFKHEIPDSLKLWIKECDEDGKDFYTYAQNGRYYIYCIGNADLDFHIDAQGQDSAQLNVVNKRTHYDKDSYILISLPAYKKLSITYNIDPQNKIFEYKELYLNQK